MTILHSIHGSSSCTTYKSCYSMLPANSFKVAIFTILIVYTKRVYYEKYVIEQFLQSCYIFMKNMTIYKKGFIMSVTSVYSVRQYKSNNWKDVIVQCGFVTYVPPGKHDASYRYVGLACCQFDLFSYMWNLYFAPSTAMKTNRYAAFQYVGP